MFLRWPYTKIAQTVQLGWTRWQPKLKIEIPSNDFSSFTSGWILKLFHRNVPWITLYQSCSNCSARMNKMAARAKSRKTFNWLLDGFWNNFTGMFLERPSIRVALTLLLAWTRWPPELKKRKIFKQLLLLNQLMDFEMISQECSLGDHQCHVVIVMMLCSDFMFVCLSTIIKSCRRNSFLCFTAFITCIHLSMASLPIFHSPLGMLHCLTC